MATQAKTEDTKLHALRATDAAYEHIADAQSVLNILIDGLLAEDTDDVRRTIPYSAQNLFDGLNIIRDMLRAANGDVETLDQIRKEFLN